MAQPKIDIPKDVLDKLLEALGVLGVLILVGIPIYYFEQLPEQIPDHFDINGKADSYGKKSSLWMLPVVGGLTFLLLFLMTSFPHKFNYLKAITKENAFRQYRIATRMVRALNLAIVWLFAVLTYKTIQQALGNSDSLGLMFLIGFLVVVLLIPVYATYKSFKE